MPSFVSDLDAPLLQLTTNDRFTLRDACAGVHVFGGIGSGKSSGTGKTLSGAYLRANMGGLVLCAKPEEIPLWLSYAKQHGRARSVIIFDESRGFNFIAWELARQGMNGLGSVTECLMRVLEAADHAAGGAGRASDEFWCQAIRQILNYAIPLIYSAHGTVFSAGFLGLSAWGAGAALLPIGRWMRRPPAIARAKPEREHVVAACLPVPWNTPRLVEITSSLPKYCQALLARRSADAPSE